MKRMLSLICALCLANWCANMASGGWVAIDDFQSYALGADANGLGTWLANDNSGAFAPAWTIGLDPNDASNRVLKGVCTDYNNHTVFNNSPSLTMPEGSTPATIFYRVRTDQSSYEVDWATAMSAVATPTSFSSIKAGLLWEAPFAPGTMDPNLDLRVYNGPGPGGVPPAGGWQSEGPVLTDQWYSVWMVLHNRVTPDAATDPTDTFDVYIQGGAYATQTLLANHVHYFRSGPAIGDLLTFMAIIDSNQVVCVDDVYVDGAGQNLGNPIPEPVTVTLLALGGAVLALRRRRRA